MSAAEALEAARQVGTWTGIDGEVLTLEGGRRAAVRAVRPTRTITAPYPLHTFSKKKREEEEEGFAKVKIRPDTPRALAGQLRPAATTAMGHFPEPEKGVTPSAASAASSASSALTPKPNPANYLAVHTVRTVGAPADAVIVRAQALKSNTATDADGAGASFRPRSAPKNTGWRARP